MKPVKFKGKIGFEIECIIKKRNETKFRELAHTLFYDVSGDGSISGYKYTTETSFELKSKVYNVEEIEQAFKDVKQIFKLIKVNKTCGLHIHVSFENMNNYYKLLSWKFVEQFERLYNVKFTSATEQERKGIRYSKFYNTEDTFKIMASDQVASPRSNGKPSSRYHSINFNAFNLYKTIEFRIFAATCKPKKFKDNVTFVLSNVDEFLVQAKFDEITMKKKLIIPKQPSPVVIREVITKEQVKQIQEGNSGENNNV